MSVPDRETPPASRSGPAYYEIHVEGWLDPRWSGWFSGLACTPTAAGQTVLAGVLPDQPALHAVLARIRDLNLNLISVIQRSI